MARKPLEQLSPAYRRRIESAIRRGKIAAEGSRQAARGHVEREHIVRRERERQKAEALGVLTSAERAYVRRRARQAAARIDGEDEADVIAAALEYATTHGYNRFRAVMARRDAMNREYRANRKGWQTRGFSMMELIAAEYEIPDARWLYYH